MNKRIGVAVTAALALSLVLPARLDAADPSVKITVQAGFENRYLAGVPVPVSVTVESPRAISGTLTVYGIQVPFVRPVVHSMHIEVPAGGRKQFDLFAPGVSPLTVQIEDGNGRRLATSQKTLIRLDETLVAVVEKPVELKPGTDQSQTGTVVANIDLGWLSLGNEVLQPVDYLVLSAETARTLPRTPAANVADWIATGGRLVLLGADADDVEWLPASWRPQVGTEAGVVTSGAGLGRVIALPSQIAGDENTWKSVIKPFGRHVGVGTNSGVEMQVAQGLVRGTSIVRLRWLIGFLLLYVFVAGPGNYLVLRRLNRRELLWLTVPGLAVLFAGAGFVLARGNRVQATVRQAVVALALPDKSVAQRIVASSTSAGGTRRIGFGRGYASAATSRDFVSGGTATTEITPSGSQVVIRTRSLEYAIASGPASESVRGYLDARVSWDGTTFLGSVENKTPYTFSDIGLVMGGRVEYLSTSPGDLHPGATSKIAYTPPAPGASPPPPSGASFQVPPNRQQQDPKYLIESLMKAFDTTLGFQRPLGFPYVAGITRDFKSRVEVDGERVLAGGAALIVSPLKVEVPAGFSGRLASAAGSTELVQVNGLQGGNFPFYPGYQGYQSYPFTPYQRFQLNNFTDAVFIWRLPPGVRRERANTPKVFLSTSINQFGGGSQGGGTFQPTGLEVFDWSQNTWIRPNPGIAIAGAPVSDDCVSPDGEVYLKVIASQFSTVTIDDIGVELQVS